MIEPDALLTLTGRGPGEVRDQPPTAAEWWVSLRSTHSTFTGEANKAVGRIRPRRYDGGVRSPRSRPRRVITRPITFLLLVSGGAVVNIAVAWACALLVDAQDNVEETVGQYADMGHGIWYLDRWDKLGSTSIHGIHYPPERIPPEPEFDVLWDLVPWWIPDREQAFRSWPEVDENGFGKYLAEARGFPMVAFRQEFEMQHLPSDGTFINIKWLVHGGIPLFRGSFTPRSVPLRPIWRGFAFNTIFYAATLWLLFIAPFHAFRGMRRIIRRRRGQCIRCGYDLRGQLPGAGCPECGWGRGTEDAT